MAYNSILFTRQGRAVLAMLNGGIVSRDYVVLSPDGSKPIPVDSFILASVEILGKKVRLKNLSARYIMLENGDSTSIVRLLHKGEFEKLLTKVVSNV